MTARGSRVVGLHAAASCGLRSCSSPSAARARRSRRAGRAPTGRRRRSTLVGDVARPQRSRLRNDSAGVDLLASTTTTSGRALERQPRAARCASFVRGAREPAAVEDAERAAAGVQRERDARAPCRRAFLFTFTRGSAGLRAEDDAAAAPLRRAGRALAGAAGALLAPRLGAAAGAPGRASWWRACPGASPRARPSRPRAASGSFASSANTSSSSLTVLLAAEDGCGERAIRRPPGSHTMPPLGPGHGAGDEEQVALDVAVEHRPGRAG